MSQVDVMSVDDIPPGSMVRVEVEGHPICLANVDGTLHAVHDTCTHGMASLSAGWLDPALTPGRVQWLHWRPWVRCSPPPGRWRWTPP